MFNLDIVLLFNLFQDCINALNGEYATLLRNEAFFCIICYIQSIITVLNVSLKFFIEEALEVDDE